MKLITWQHSWIWAWRVFLKMWLCKANFNSNSQTTSQCLLTLFLVWKNFYSDCTAITCMCWTYTHIWDVMLCQWASIGRCSSFHMWYNCTPICAITPRHCLVQVTSTPTDSPPANLFLPTHIHTPYFFQTGMLLGSLDPEAFNFKGKAVILL